MVRTLNLNDISSRAREAFESRPISRAFVFGSYARGEQDADSDVDICYELCEGERLKDADGNEARGFAAVEAISALRNDLERALGIAVDLVPMPVARSGMARSSQILLEEIRRDGRLVYERT